MSLSIDTFLLLNIDSQTDIIDHILDNTILFDLDEPRSKYYSTSNFYKFIGPYIEVQSKDTHIMIYLIRTKVYLVLFHNSIYLIPRDKDIKLENEIPRDEMRTLVADLYHVRRD